MDMTDHEERGEKIRELCKSLVLDFMRATPECYVGNSEGMKQSKIFRACGFDFGNYKKATSSNQQYLIVAILRELESENKVEQIKESGP
jgi:hypothetical protein